MIVCSPMIDYRTK